MAIWEAELTMGRGRCPSLALPSTTRSTLQTGDSPQPWESRIQTWWQKTISPQLNFPCRNKPMLSPQTIALRKIKSASNRGEEYKHSFTLHWDEQDVWKNHTKPRLRFTAQLSSCSHQKHNTRKETSMQKACAQPPREHNKETGMPDATKEAGGPELTFDHLSPQCI